MNGDDGRWTMMEDERVETCFFCLSCRGCSGDHRGDEWPSKNSTAAKFTKSIAKKSVVIRWYGYQSIRTDLISKSRSFLDRN